MCIKKLNQKFKISLLDSSVLFTCTALFLAGIGPGKILLSVFVMYSLVIISTRSFNLNRINIWSWIGIILWGLFLLYYYFLYETPFMPENINGRLDFWQYTLKAIPTISIFILIISARNFNKKFIYLSSLALGCLAIASLNTIATIIYLDPPYYGKAWEYFSKTVMNSPGTTILSSIASIVFLSFSNIQNLKNLKFSFLLILTLFAAFSINLIFLARSFFFIFFIILLIKMFFNLLDLKQFKKVKVGFILYLSAISILLLSSSLYLIFSENLLKITYRILNGEYMVKFGHTLEYFTLISDNFFCYPQSFYFRPEQFWFHNFFFDVHRSSGPFVAILSYAILALLLIKLVYNLKNKHPYAREMFAFFCGFFGYLYTSIPWESSEYQMIFIYSAISAMVLSSKSDESNHKPSF